MKKTLLLTLEWPPMRGGVAEYLSGIFGALPQDRVAVRCYNTTLYRSKMPMRWLGSLPAAFRAAKREHAEIVVISHVLPMGYIVLLLRALRGLPYVVIVHGMDLRMAELSSWKRFWAGVILRRAHAVIANSAWTAALTRDVYRVSEDRLHVVHPCPSKAAMREPSAGEVKALRDRLGLNGKKVLLSVGRLVRRKGFDLVIETLPKLRYSCGDVVYVLAGVGPEEEHLRGLAADLNVSDHVLFAGDISPEAIPAWYRLGDVFVTVARELPGDVEGFGIVFLEAGRHGLPVIGARTGGVAEAVADGETGLLIAPEDTHAFFEAVCTLLNSPEKAAALGRRGRERVLKTFTCAAQAERLETVLS